MIRNQTWGIILAVMTIAPLALAQKNQEVTVLKSKQGNRVDISIGGKPFTSLLYPDSLEKPVLYPLLTASGTVVTRSFPLAARAGDPTDHPHHIGLWFNFENLNGLDFWNNSSAIPADRKNHYGWVRTNRILQTKSGETGLLSYQASWTNQKKEVILQETTSYEFSGIANQRIIDRTTILTADQDATFTDAKDGLLGLRLAHELQMPNSEDQKIDKKYHVANGNYLTSAGKSGDEAWGTRAIWCKVFGKMGADSVSIAIIDHPENLNYPTYWHARGYGLFAANPLGEKIFSNGQSQKMLTLKKGETVTFRYRIVIHNDRKTLSTPELNAIAASFAKAKPAKL